jgi:hypothetical protein
VALVHGEGGSYPVHVRKLTVAYAGLVAATTVPLAGVGIGTSTALAWAAPSAVVVARATPAQQGASAFVTAGTLNAVAASSARNAWAVGYAGADPALATTTLTVHWNGTTWKRLPSPSPGRQGELSAVAVRSAHLAWAVGSYDTSIGEKTLILRWNGRTWKQVRSPSPAVLNSLTAVDVLSARDAWAAGTGENDNGDVTAASRPGRLAGSPPPAIDLVLHWNGTRWQRVPCSSPPPSGDNLAGLAASSPRDAWLVGTRNSERPATLTEHWNGSHWTRVPSPNPGKLPSLNAVAIMSPRDVWAVGTSTSQHPLIEHWNGAKWKPARSPAAPGGALSGLAASSARNAWAVGNATSGPLVLRWNGTTWRRIPIRADSNSYLQGVAATSAGNAWAVGSVGTGTSASYRTLIEHWNGKAWT